jgi:hypothetical protein
LIAWARGPLQLHYLAGDKATVRVWDPDAGAHLHELTGHGRGLFGGGVAAPGRPDLTISGSRDQTVLVWMLPSPLASEETTSPKLAC